MYLLPRACKKHYMLRYNSIYKKGIKAFLRVPPIPPLVIQCVHHSVLHDGNKTSFTIAACFLCMDGYWGRMAKWCLQNPIEVPWLLGKNTCVLSFSIFNYLFTHTHFSYTPFDHFLEQKSYFSTWYYVEYFTLFRHTFVS